MRISWKRGPRQSTRLDGIGAASRLKFYGPWCDRALRAMSTAGPGRTPHSDSCLLPSARPLLAGGQSGLAVRLLHQHLAELQAVAGRIAESGEFHHAGNFFDRAFKLDAARKQAFALAFDVIHAENNCCTRLFSGLRISCQTDRCLALGVAEFRPALDFENFLQAQSMAVKFLSLLEIFHAEPCHGHFHHHPPFGHLACYEVSRLRRGFPPKP